MALPKFAEYARRAIVRINSGLMYLLQPELYLYKILKPILLIFVMLALTLALQVMLASDYESILRIAEFLIISSGTLAILTFSYAHEKKGYATYEQIVRSGELLFQCTVTLIIGLGLLPQVGFMLRNHANVSGLLGRFAGVYDVIFPISVSVIMIIGTFSLFMSASFLIFGIWGLIDVFETNH